MRGLNDFNKYFSVPNAYDILVSVPMRGLNDFNNEKIWSLKKHKNMFPSPCGV